VLPEKALLTRLLHRSSVLHLAGSDEDPSHLGFAQRELGKKMNNDRGSRFGNFNRLNGLGRREPEAKGGGADEIYKLGFLGKVIGFGSISTEA